MDILCTPLHAPDLSRWEGRPFSPGVEYGPRPRDNRDNHEREVAIESLGPPEPDGPHRRAAVALFAFNVFPPPLVIPLLRRVPVERNDTVGIRYHFLPGVDLFFAARVTACFDGPEGDLWRTGFSYRTLRGHPETGDETFCVEKDMKTGRVRVALRSWSRTGGWLAWLGYPVVRRLQLRAGRLALDHLGEMARGVGLASAAASATISRDARTLPREEGP
jgi:hypothetical protein